LSGEEPDKVGGSIGQESQRRDEQGEGWRIDIGRPQRRVGEGMVEERGVQRLAV
jgi:hypothetical protein